LCSIAISSADAIKDIESGKKGALSWGYRYEPDMTPACSPNPSSCMHMLKSHTAAEQSLRLLVVTALVRLAR
jgi:hypothetical protein